MSSDFKTLAELAAENKRLKEDSARLDWLDRNAQIRDRTLALMERNGDGPMFWAGIEFDGVEETVRKAIDAAMKP